MDMVKRPAGMDVNGRPLTAWRLAWGTGEKCARADTALEQRGRCPCATLIHL